MFRPGLSAITSIVGWALIGFLLLALFGSNALGLDARPDLGVVVIGAGSDMRPVTAPGQPFFFTIGLDNMKGATDAHHVILAATLPNGVKFQSSDPAPTRVENGNHPIWEMDTLLAKALPRLFQVTAETDTDLAPGSQVEISAAVESREGDANPADNHANYTIYVQNVGAALVFLGSTLDAVPVTAEGPTTFKVRVRNAGNLPATGSRLQATLPKGVKFDKGEPPPAFSSGQVVTFKLGDLARAESKSVSMTVELDVLERSDLLSNDRPLTFAFQVSRMTSDGEVTDSHFEIAKHIESVGQDVAIWLMTEAAKVPGEVSPKTDVTCVIKCANLGNESARKVVVALYLGSGLAIGYSKPQPTRTGTDDAFPAKMSVGLAAGFNQPTGTVTNAAFPGGVARWDVGDLGVGMSRTVRSVIHATSIPDDGALVTAAITADGIDLDTTNNAASLLWHNPLSQGALKSQRPSAAAVKTVGVSEKAREQPVSHRWRYFFALILLIVVVLIFLRARRKP